jgi:hypothetical protein
MDVWRPAPRSLADVRDPDADATSLYPRHVLRDSRTALCLFSARWHGRQDAYWLAEAGLRTTCVDQDEARLREMKAVYPPDWEFVAGDAFETAQWRDMKWDVVSLDPFTDLFDRCADNLPLWCALANDAVILGCATDQQITAPAGWQEVRRVFRSSYGGGVEWVVLQPTGQGIDPSQVSACLVTRGDQPEQMARIIETLPYDEVIVWDNSKREDHKTAGRYMAALEAKHDVVYFQDDDTLFRHHAELCAAYEPGRITAVYAHGENPGGYDDMALVGGGALADRDAVCAALGGAESDAETLAYMDFHVGILTPYRHVHLPFEINMEIAQHPSRLCNQPWAAAAKARVTERARAIRDSTA